MVTLIIALLLQLGVISNVAEYNPDLHQLPDTSEIVEDIYQL